MTDNDFSMFQEVFTGPVMVGTELVDVTTGELTMGMSDMAGGGRGASFGGPDSQYRYDLWRRWSDGPVMGWLMLNPSTADAFKDDHTIRQCRKYAAREGFGALVVRNLFALRTPHPNILFVAPEDERVGPDADEWITRLRDDADVIVAAWGADRRAWPRIEYVERELVRGWELKCFAITAEGQPGHPARLRDDAPMLTYQG